MSAIRSANEEPVPFARSRVGSPIAYAALGAAFHLEPLEASDVERLALACDLVLAATKTSLKWSFSSVHAEVEPFSPGSLELVSSYPTLLLDTSASSASYDDPRARAGARAMTAAHYDKFGVACHGGKDRNVASPWTFRFYATVREGGAEPLLADAMLAFTVPTTTPLAEFEALAKNVAKDLRVRWGAAGLAYGAWELDRYGETRDAIYAHARRYPGFDVGQHATWMRAFHDRLRTVSWLTFLGSALADEVRARGDDLASDALVTVEPCGEGVVFRAGERPEPGDVNRRLVPRAYAQVDGRLRSIRAKEGIHFYAPWSVSTTEAWLRRFESNAGV